MNTFDSLTISSSGCNLIEASAGTGKTYAIASLFVRLVIENELYRPENILVVTFTEAATKELRDRIRKRLREARDVAAGVPTSDPFLKALISSDYPGWPGTENALERLDYALQTFDCAAISTIHGFCSRALLENAFESGSLFDTELVADQKPLIRQIVDDFWRSRFFASDSPLLPLAEKEGWSPGNFVKFLKGKLTNPTLKIVPEFTQEEIESIAGDCTNDYETICTLWKTMRGEIEQILLTHPGLSRNQKLYRADVIPELTEAMDFYVTQGSPFALFAGCKKLTAGFMVENRLKKDPPPEHQFFSTWDLLINSVHRMAITVYADLVAYAKQRLPERKRAQNVRFFDDLLSDMHSALTGPGGELLAGRMRGKYRAALIDEFQDTDQIQFKIFRAVFNDVSLPLFLIGDPKQAIYSFRGADIYAYLEAKKDVSHEFQHTMTLNWRSSGKLVEAVNHLFSQNRDRPLVIEGLSYPDVKVPDATEKEQKEVVIGERDPSPMQIWFFSREDKEKSISLKRGVPAVVKAVTDEIAALLKDGSEGKVTIGDKPLVPGDIAVIVRGHKQAKKIYDSLQATGIPAVVRSDQSVFQTPEALELRKLLNALAEPGNEAKVRASLATAIMGVSADDIARTFDADGEAEWEKRLTSFREYHDLWNSFGFMAMFRVFLDNEDVRARLLPNPGGERSITNLLHCGELLHAEASESHRGVEALCTWFSEQVASPPEAEEHQIRLESDEKAVKILTIHVSKGLEFPIVFCPFLWGGVFDGGETVMAHEGFELVADFGSDSFELHRKAALDEGLAENVRLLYVSLTRAKYRCYMAWGRFRYSESSAISYLLHAPEHREGGSFCEELVNVMNSISDDTMIERVQSLESPGVIHLAVDPADAAAGGLTRLQEEFGSLSCRAIAKQIENDWMVTSFSSLVDGHASPPEQRDHDSGDESTGPGDEDLADGSSIFSFPKGSSAGSFLHSIFEEIDFASTNTEDHINVVSRLLASSLYDTGYTEMLSRMLFNVLEAELSEGLRLSGLHPGSWVQEMEFYFPLKAINPKLLTGFFSSCGVTSPVDLERVAAQLNFRSVKGMLLGFIDMVFCHGGRYYIIDWKSNHLGNHLENYSPQNLARDMERKLYPLQYLLYTVAVNRYLQRRVPGYSYESSFGGVFYLYLRGVDPSRPGNGIYFDKPDAGLVQGLTECLIDIEGA